MKTQPPVRTRSDYLLPPSTRDWLPEDPLSHPGGPGADNPATVLVNLVWSGYPEAMKTVNIQAAKTHLSRLVEQALAGEDVVIARDNVPMVRLVPVDRPAARRQFGAHSELGPIGSAFDELLPDDELDAWEGQD